MIAAMVLVVAGCAYAGVSYYYTSHFFEGTTINGIDSSNRTAYEVEQEIAGKKDNYTIQVRARMQGPRRPLQEKTLIINTYPAVRFSSC